MKQKTNCINYIRITVDEVSNERLCLPSRSRMQTCKRQGAQLIIIMEDKKYISVFMQIYRCMSKTIIGHDRHHTDSPKAIFISLINTSIRI